MTTAAHDAYYERYTPSGEYPLPFFLAALPILGALAFGIGAVLSSTQFCAIALPQVVAGFAFGWTGGQILRFIHFRNPQRALGLGIGFGVFIYMAEYYTRMLRLFGTANWYRIDALPRFINLVVNNWKVGQAGDDAQPFPILNWIVFLVELASVSAVAGYWMWRITSAAYCERCQNWATDVHLRLPMPTGMSIKEALVSGKLAELPETRSLLGDPGQQPHLQLQLEGCMHDGEAKEPCAWLTISPCSVQNGFVAKANELIQAALTRQQLDLLAAKIPGLLSAK